MDVQSHAVAEAVEKSERAVFAGAGVKAGDGKKVGALVVHVGRNDTGPESFFGVFPSFQYGFKGFFHNVRRLSFDHGSGQIPPVAGGAEPGKKIHHNRRSGVDLTAAFAVRTGALNTAGDDGGFRRCAVAHEFQLNGGAQPFAGQRSAFKQQCVVRPDFGGGDQCEGAAHTLFGGAQGFDDLVGLGAGLELAFRPEFARLRDHREAGRTHFVGRQQREVGRHGKAVQTVKRRDSEKFVNGARSAELRLRMNRDSGLRFAFCPVELQNGHHNMAAAAVRQFKKNEFIRRGKTAGVTHIAVVFTLADDQFRVLHDNNPLKKLDFN